MVRSVKHNIWKHLGFFVLLTFMGCSTAHIPSYIQDKSPYKQTFYGTYEEVLNATLQALEDHGWLVERTTDPSVYERSKTTVDPNARSVLIMTKVKKYPKMTGSRYGRLNIYLVTNTSESTDLEVRFLTVNSLTFKSFKNYRHDDGVQALFQSIEKKIQ